MSVRPEILLLIILCMVVTIVPRVLPFLTAHHIRPTPRVIAWFRFLPLSILSALILPAILLPDGEFSARLLPEIPAAILSVIIITQTRSITATIIGGMLAYALLDTFL